MPKTRTAVAVACQKVGFSVFAISGCGEYFNSRLRWNYYRWIRTRVCMKFSA